MRRLYTILLILSLIGFIILCAYAFVDQVRIPMQTHLGPPLTAAFGGFATAITTSFIWQHYIIPFPNQLVIGAVLIGMPIMWLASRVYTRKVRPTFVKSAMRDSGMYPMSTQPVSTPSVTVTQPAPTKAETPPPAQPVPTPTPAPVPEKPPAET